MIKGKRAFIYEYSSAVDAGPSSESERCYGFAPVSPASRMRQLKIPPISGIAVMLAGIAQIV
jgi:hypothetical protein